MVERGSALGPAPNSRGGGYVWDRMPAAECSTSNSAIFGVCMVPMNGTGGHARPCRGRLIMVGEAGRRPASPWSPAPRVALSRKRRRDDRKGYVGGARGARAGEMGEALEKGGERAPRPAVLIH